MFSFLFFHILMIQCEKIQTVGREQTYM